MNADRLNKLADFLDTLNEQQFNFEIVAKRVCKSDTITCGTVGCAIGFTPHVFPELVKYEDREGLPDNEVTVEMIDSPRAGHNYSQIGQLLFNIPYIDSMRLFAPDCPNHWNKDDCLGPMATSQQVAQSIRNYIEYETNNQR